MILKSHTLSTHTNQKIMHRLTLTLFLMLFALHTGNSAILKGQVKNRATGELYSYANIYVEGTNIATLTDELGNYQINSLEGSEATIVAHIPGFSHEKRSVELTDGENILNFELNPSLRSLDEVVVTANRNEIKRKEASVIVGIVDPTLLENSGSHNLAEGLNFQAGLRVENN